MNNDILARLKADIKSIKDSANENGAGNPPEGYAELDDAKVADTCWQNGLDCMETAVLNWIHDQEQIPAHSAPSPREAIERALAGYSVGSEVHAIDRVAFTDRLLTALAPHLSPASDDDDLLTITQRDAAEEAANKMASLILGEPIDWSDHEAKWQEAIDGFDPPSDALHGTLTRAGTFHIRDEEVTGYLITCTREELERVKHLPMMQRVVIVAASDARDSVRLDWIIKNDAHCVLDDGSVYDRPPKWDVFYDGRFESDYNLRSAIDAAIASQSAQGEQKE